jgi:hypothetical protein
VLDVADHTDARPPGRHGQGPGAGVVALRSQVSAHAVAS